MGKSQPAAKANAQQINQKGVIACLVIAAISFTDQFRLPPPKLSRYKKRPQAGPFLLVGQSVPEISLGSLMDDIWAQLCHRRPM